MLSPHRWSTADIRILRPTVLPLPLNTQPTRTVFTHRVPISRHHRLSLRPSEERSRRIHPALTTNMTPSTTNNSPSNRDSTTRQRITPIPTGDSSFAAIHTSKELPPRSPREICTYDQRTAG